MKKGIVGQLFGMFWTKLVVTIFEMLIGFSAVAGLQNHPVAATIISMLFLLFEFSQLYSAAFEAAEFDKRPYTKNKSVPWKGIYLPAVILLFTLMLYVLYRIAWIYGGGSDGLQNLKSVAMNVPFVLWTIVYDPFLKLNLGHARAAGMAVLFLLPVVASGLGYYAGYRDFSVTEKFMPFIYDKKKNRK